MNTQIRFYNPREASPELLEAMLVGREGIVQEILDDLARQATSSSRQHWLIRGPRGIGKTHLVGILYHRLRKDEKLAKRFLPVWLAETDAYSVYSAAVLLLQIAERLVEELRLSGDPRAGEIEVELNDLSSGGDDPGLFEEICEILKGEARSRGKILVILMENLDALLAGLPGQRGVQEVRRLRSLLSQDKEFLFVSTTPTRYLAAVSDPKQPLYGHLKERSLQALTETEVGQLLQRLAEVTGQTERLAPLQEEREGRIRRRVLHRLTGGNPRAVVMAFTVLSGAPGVHAMVEEMSALLDTQTAYFEARLAQLAPRERAIVGAMALSRKNLTLQEIARLTRLPLRSLSVQIDRLREQGYLYLLAGEGGKGTLYEVSDGLFRVWYQYRKGRKILQPLVQFLALWFPDEELENTLLAIRTMGTASATLANNELSKLVEVQILEALNYSRSAEGKSARQQIWAAGLPDEQFSRIMEIFVKNPSLLDKISAIDQNGETRLFSNISLYVAHRLFAQRRYSESELVVRSVLKREESWIAYGLLAAITGVTGTIEEAIALADKFIQNSPQNARGVSFRPLVSMIPSMLIEAFDETIDAEDYLVRWVDSVSMTPHSITDQTFFYLALLARPNSVEVVLQRLSKSPVPENAEAARLFLNVENVLKAEATAHPGRRKSTKARRQEALAQVPPELRSAVEELAQKVRAFRKKLPQRSRGKS